MIRIGKAWDKFRKEVIDPSQNPLTLFMIECMRKAFYAGSACTIKVFLEDVAEANVEDVEEIVTGMSIEILGAISNIPPSQPVSRDLFSGPEVRGDN